MRAALSAAPSPATVTAIVRTPLSGGHHPPRGTIPNWMNVPTPLPLAAHWAESPVFQVAAVLALLLVAFLFFLILFEPGLEYNVQPPPSAPDSEGYLSLVGALTATPVHRDTRVEVLTDG